MVRALLERAVTKKDYFHQFHGAEEDIADPSRSYYYDLRARANYRGPFAGALPQIDYGGLTFTNPVHAAQYGIGNLQQYWDSGDERLLLRAKAVATALVESAEQQGDALFWRYPLTIRGARNWLSAMAQGQIASLLLRVGSRTGQASLHDAAKAALEPFFVDIVDGGVRAELDGQTWFEEYAFEPVPFTLNGFIVALLGLRDLTRLHDAPSQRHASALQQGLDTLRSAMPHFDCRGWSRYDLLSRKLAGVRLRNLASPFYHRFHVELLTIMMMVAPDPTFEAIRHRWQTSLDSGTVFFTATAEKVLYRLVTTNPQATASARE